MAKNPEKVTVDGSLLMALDFSREPADIMYSKYCQLYGSIRAVNDVSKFSNDSELFEIKDIYSKTDPNTIDKVVRYEIGYNLLQGFSTWSGRSLDKLADLEVKVLGKFQDWVEGKRSK